MFYGLHWQQIRIIVFMQKLRREYWIQIALKLRPLKLSFWNVINLTGLKNASKRSREVEQEINLVQVQESALVTKTSLQAWET